MLDPSLFVSDAIHEREIVLADGQKHLLHFKEIASGDFEKLRAPGQDPQAAHAAVSRIIAASLCNPDGTAALKTGDAAKLKDGVRLALSIAIAEVNGIGAHVGKVSPPEASFGSGTSSSSPESEDGQSPKQSDGSVAQSS